MADAYNNILGLQLPTDPRWVNLASISMEEILTDHAFCEQKATTSAISLIQRYPQFPKLVEDLCPIVTEEWGHFRLVLAELHKRGYTLGKQRKDEYVNALQAHQNKAGSPQQSMLDRLLIFALIEARSCERFRLLSLGLEEERMRNFYHRFMESEAGHYRTFLDIANTYIDKKIVENRWQFWLDTEKEILKNWTIRGDRMH